MRTSDEIVKDIIEYFKTYEDEFNDCIEELDSLNGYLNEDRYYPMSELDDLEGGKPSEIIDRVFYGYDEDTYDTDASGHRTYGKFNPNRPWFKWDGYGNLVSAESKDYTGFLDEYFVKAVSERGSAFMRTVGVSEELSLLFDELADCEE